MRFGKFVLSFSLVMFFLSANVNAQCSGGLGQGQFVKRIVSRAVTPVVNTVSLVAQNRPRPLVRLLHVTLPSRVEPVTTALRNVATIVPRAVRHLRAVRHGNFINSNLFHVPVEQTVESEPVNEVSVDSESSGLSPTSI